MKDLNEKTVIVTGGAQGIGKGIVSTLLDRGARVAIADVDVEAGTECLAELANSDRLLFVETDVADENSAQGCIAEVLDRFRRMDALVNNAGIADPGSTPIDECSVAQWERIIRTNLTGAFLMAKHAVPHLRRNRGSIVNIASTRALQSEANTEAYSASKGGLVALTHALAVSLGPDVRVNCISPGWIDVSQWKTRRLREPAKLRDIDHRQHPVGRVGTPEDIGEIAAFLISDKAGFITGENFVVDGGMTRKMIYRD